MHYKTIVLFCLATFWAWGSAPSEDESFHVYPDSGTVCTNNLASMKDYLEKNPSFPVKSVNLAASTTPDEAEEIMKWIIKNPNPFKKSLTSIDCSLSLRAVKRVQLLLDDNLTEGNGFTALRNVWWHPPYFDEEYGIVSTDSFVELVKYCASNPPSKIRLINLSPTITSDEAEAIVRWIIGQADSFKGSLESIDCDNNLRAKSRIWPLLEAHITKEKGFTVLRKNTWWQSEASVPQQFWIFITSCWRRTESPPLLHDKRE